MKKLLLPTILGLFLLAGCATEGYVATTVVYPAPVPVYTTYPVVVYPYPVYHPYYRPCPPPVVIHPIPHFNGGHNRPVPPPMPPRGNPPHR